MHQNKITACCVLLSPDDKYFKLAMLRNVVPAHCFKCRLLEGCKQEWDKVCTTVLTTLIECICHFMFARRVRLTEEREINAGRPALILTRTDRCQSRCTTTIRTQGNCRAGHVEAKRTAKLAVQVDRNHYILQGTRSYSGSGAGVLSSISIEPIT